MFYQPDIKLPKSLKTSKSVVSPNKINTLLCAALYCFPVLIVTQFLSIMYFTNSASPFSFIISIPNLRFVRVINCPNRIMNGLYILQSLTDSNLLQSAHELNPFSIQHGLTLQTLYPMAHFGVSPLHPSHCPFVYFGQAPQ